jgi:hypothetical protein
MNLSGALSAISSSRHKNTSVVLTGSLQDNVSSTVFDLDATKSASYDGTSQTWANLVVAPADGSAQSAYDFTLGTDNTVTTDDPTFNGSAGNAAAYFSFDGGDFFEIAGAMTQFLKDLHKTTGGQSHWVAVAGQLTAGTTQCLFSTGTTAGVHGVRFNWGASEGITAQQLGSATVTATPAEVNFQTGLEYLVVMSYDVSTSTFKFWLNGLRYADIVITPSTSTTDSTQCRIGATPATTPALMQTSGARLYSVAAGNAVLDNTGEAAIRAALETRHGRSYTRPSQTTLAASVASTGVVFQLDTHLYNSVFKSDSFTNDWSNVIASPADGSAQTAYDFPDVSLPPFINFGDASGPRWNNGAGDYWQIAANTQFLKDLHKTTGGSDFWLLVVGISDGLHSALSLHFATAAAVNSPGADGVTLGSTSTEILTFRQNGTSAAGDAATLAGAGSFTAAHFLYLISYSHSNANFRVWFNSTTAVDVANTFATSTTDATGLATIGAESDGGNAAAADIDWISVYMGNSYIDNTKAAEIIAYVESLHGRDYTP